MTVKPTVLRFHKLTEQHGMHKTMYDKPVANLVVLNIFAQHVVTPMMPC